MTLDGLFNFSEHQKCHEMRIVGTWREPDEESFFPTLSCEHINIFKTTTTALLEGEA